MIHMCHFFDVWSNSLLQKCYVSSMNINCFEVTELEAVPVVEYIADIVTECNSHICGINDIANQHDELQIHWSNQ